MDDYTIEKRVEPLIPLHTHIDQETYDICPKNLDNGKMPELDKIPKSILKNHADMEIQFLVLFFTHYYKQKQIHAY